MNLNTKFKCPEKGTFYTQGLFYELTHNQDRALYTLKEHDYTLPNGRVLPSIKQLYLDERDLTEYRFANKYFFSWPHWQRCLGNAMIRKEVEGWREELELLMMSEGLQGVIDEATSGKSYQAAKWLAEKGWLDKSKGRPSNEDKNKVLKQAARAKAMHDDDLSRIRDFIK
jgi:hypothetical protein